MRINIDDYFLNIARAVSLRSTCIRRQYGAVIVKNNVIVSTGYNGSPRGCVNCCDKNICNRTHKEHNKGSYAECKSVHAEQNALIQASYNNLQDATLYLYGKENDNTKIIVEPCEICKRMIANSGIKRVVTNSDEFLLYERYLKEKYKHED